MNVRLFFLSALLVPCLALAATPSKEPATMHAQGKFDVKVKPQTPDNPEAQASGLSRLSLDKRFHGVLDATSKGEMLASGDGTRSGAYVALETVTGTLQGRSGSFVLMHSAVMRQGVPENWSVTVVADSGTGELTGLEGAMKIVIADGVHSYEFEYTLPDA
jgi:hypothetical protein